MKYLNLLFILIILNFNNSLAQCNISNPYHTNTITGLFGQSFEANCNGFLNYVQFYTFPGATIPADTFYIYSGNNTLSPIYTQHYSSIPSGDSVTLIITGSVPVTIGNQYTFEINSSNVNVPIRIGGDTYSGGGAFHNGISIGPADLAFGVGIVSTVSVDESIFDSTVIYPNPSNGEFIILLDKAGNYHISISNSIGQILFNKYIMNSSEQAVKLDVSPGIYFLQLETDGAFFTKKILVN